MPYTPPSQRSPATSKPTSPVLSRAHSYNHEHKVHQHLPHSHATEHRPNLPRSVSSTSYLNKHRRTPSISDKQNGDSVKPGSSGSSVNGAVTTPPDSKDNSSDDEDRGRPRDTTPELAKLAEALQKIELKRDPSPSTADDSSIPLHISTAALDLASPPLSAEARKIAHSRSASELALSTKAQLVDSPIQTSDESEEDGDDLTVKPPLLRKKSGELVKPALRPPSRRRPSSMPGTPTFSKAVHFNENMEQVRHFLQVDRPIAVSAGSSPVEIYDSESEYPFGEESRFGARMVEWEIKLANFPGDIIERQLLPVRVERIFLSADHKTLIGTVACANIAFQKVVIARFTLDYWKTTSEVVAEYNNDVRKKQVNDGYDRFNFNIKLADQANLESKTLLLCIRYVVNGTEFWDNNNSMNYQVDFIKKPRAKVGAQGHSAGALGSIPRSRHTNSSASRSRATFEEEFANGINQKYEFGNASRLTSESPNHTIKLRKSRKGSVFPDPSGRKINNVSSPFQARYDFGASLTAALSNAQSALGDASGLQPRTGPNAKAGYFAHKSISGAATAPVMSPSAEATPAKITSEKPEVGSEEYKELIQKYCFFGSGKASPNVSSPPASNDGARDNDSDNSPPGSALNSGSNTPSPNGMSPNLDGANDKKTTHKTLSRSTSPGSFGSRTASPVSFGYPYHQTNVGGIFPEATLTAIRG